MDDLSFLDDPEVPSTRVIIDTRKELALPAASAADTKELSTLVSGEESPQEPVLLLPEAVMQRNESLRLNWYKLSERQRAFLLALRDNYFSERAAVKALEGTPFEVARHYVRRKWDDEQRFATCRRLLEEDSAKRALDKSRQVLRAERLAELNTEMKPVLYHGVPTGFYEMENGELALRANEQLMRVAGHLKSAEAVRVKVRIVNLAGPEDDKVIDGTAIDVDVSVPDFLE